MEAIGDQLENSQYSPTHIVQYEEDMDTRYSPSRPTEDVSYSPSHPTRDNVQGAGSRCVLFDENLNSLYFECFFFFLYQVDS